MLSGKCTRVLIAYTNAQCDRFQNSTCRKISGLKGHTCWVSDVCRTDRRARSGNRAEGTPQESQHGRQTANLPCADGRPLTAMACCISDRIVVPSGSAAQQLVVVRCCVPHQLAK